MKNIFKTGLMLLFAVVVTNCSQEEQETFKTFTGEAISFRGVSTYQVVVPEEDASVQIPATVSTLSSESRSFSVVATGSEGTDGEYTVGDVVIPANEYDGVLTVDFDFSEIGGEDGDVKELVLQIVPSGDAQAYNDTVTISYFREIICNDLELTIVSDVWANETYWTLKDADGNAIVERFFPFTSPSVNPQEYNLEFNLPDGDYTYEMGDTYGDGMEGTGGGVTLIGTYELVCSIITHAEGSGAFSPAIPDPFPGAPNAIVEITDFTVNP